MRGGGGISSCLWPDLRLRETKPFIRSKWPQQSGVVEHQASLFQTIEGTVLQESVKAVHRGGIEKRLGVRTKMVALHFAGDARW